MLFQKTGVQVPRLVAHNCLELQFQAFGPLWASAGIYELTHTCISKHEKGFVNLKMMLRGHVMTHQANQLRQLQKPEFDPQDHVMDGQNRFP